MLERCLLENPPTNKYSGPLSLAIHGAVIALLLLAGRVVTHPPTLLSKPGVLLMPDISSYVRKLSGGGGGGGDGSQQQASLGRPAPFALEQFTPARPVIRDDEHKLDMDPTLIGPPEVQLPKSNLTVWGVLNGIAGSVLSNGPGSGGGAGTGKGTGNGPGKGPGLGEGEDGGFGKGVFHSGTAGVSAPQVVYRVEPEFTDAARQAKHQGSVLLGIVVDADGRVRDPKVINPLGMGLDERAITAVQQWKFKPGTKDGHAVPVYAQVLVTFRLL